MKFIKIFLTLFLFSTAAFSTQALQRTVTFTQPDGTKFQGAYKGDAAFHWIESEGSVVVYNPKDKYYYKAVVDKTKGLLMTSEKPAPLSTKLTGLNVVNSVKKTLSDTDRTNLRILQKKAKSGNYPR
jgi:hypothetical protein